VSRPKAFAAAFLASLAAACARSTTPGSTSSIAFEVKAGPSGRATRLTRKKSSSGECVVWLGDAASPDRLSLRIAAGTSLERADDGKDKDLCATPVEPGLSWPA